MARLLSAMAGSYCPAAWELDPPGARKDAVCGSGGGGGDVLRVLPGGVVARPPGVVIFGVLRVEFDGPARVGDGRLVLPGGVVSGTSGVPVSCVLRVEFDGPTRVGDGRLVLPGGVGAPPPGVGIL